MEETTSEREERLEGWEAFLRTPEASKGLQCSDSMCASERAGPSASGVKLIIIGGRINLAVAFKGLK